MMDVNWNRLLKHGRAWSWRIRAGLMLGCVTLASVALTYDSHSGHAPGQGSPARDASGFSTDAAEPRHHLGALVVPPPTPSPPIVPQPPQSTGPSIAPPARPNLFNAPPPRPAPPPPDPGVYLPAPLIAQAYPLDCESAALQVALATKGINVTQQWIFNQLPQDPRPPVMSGGYPVQWGDPFNAFVGDVYGKESNFTGYGVYYGPITNAAADAGAQAVGRAGWTADAIEDQIRQGNPVVVWVNYDFSASGVGWWTGWDGASVPYTTKEHAVTVVGFNAGNGTISVVDVWNGTLRTLSKQKFAAALTTFGGMGVAVSSPSPSPSATPSPSPSPSPSHSPTPSPSHSPSPSPSPHPPPSASPTGSPTPTPSPSKRVD